MTIRNEKVPAESAAKPKTQTIRPVGIPSEEAFGTPTTTVGRSIQISWNVLVSELSVSVEPFKREVIHFLAQHPAKLHELTPRKFEELIAQILRDMGCDTELTPQTRDGGRDILATFKTPHFSKVLTIVECKKYKPDHKVGIEIVRQFLYVLDQKDRASCGLIATTSSFSSEAVAEATSLEYKLQLKNLDGIKEWLAKYGTWHQQQESGVWSPNLQQT